MADRIGRLEPARDCGEERDEDEQEQDDELERLHAHRPASGAQRRRVRRATERISQLERRGKTERRRSRTAVRDSGRTSTKRGPGTNRPRSEGFRLS